MSAANMPVSTSYPASIEIDGPPGKDSGVPFLIRPFTGIDLVIQVLIRNIIAYIHLIIIWVTVLTSGKVPEASFNTITQTMAFTARVQGWIYGLTDTKPGSGADSDGDFPIRLHFEYTPEVPRLSILMNPLWTIVLYICFIPGLIMGVIGVYLGYLTKLFTGTYNEWAFEKVKRLFEWGIRLGFFGALLTATQPPIEYV